MTLDDILISAKEKAQRSAGQWLSSQYQRKSIQHIPQVEARAERKENTIEVILLMHGEIKPEDVPAIAEYSRRFILDMLGYLNTETLRNTRKVILIADKKIGERIVPMFYHEYSVERTSGRDFQAVIGRQVFPITRKYDPSDTRHRIAYPSPQNAVYSEGAKPKRESALRAAAGAIRDLFNAIRYSR